MARKRKKPVATQSYPERVRMVARRLRPADHPELTYTVPTGQVCKKLIPQKRKTGPPKPYPDCPVELTFVEGRPALRFCFEPKTAGYVMPVEGPEQAQQLAREICGCWRARKQRNPRSSQRDRFTACVPRGTRLRGR